MSLSHAILTALIDENLTGYELAKQFDVSLGFFWQASHQQIYRELKQLHEQGFVAVEEVPQLAKPDKRVYSLTAAGQKMLEVWILAPTRSRHSKDELFIKLYNVGLVPVASIVAAIGQRQAEHQRKLALYRKIESRSYADPAQLSDRKKGIYLSLLAGIRQEEMGLGWCSDARKLLASVTT
ncbi:MAG: PadR family transcriptional regulator [Pseudomonadales bacterium]|jgi:DNA-binding PadR family transcriptional regulator|nr:PadR family transcriptional regulator [Pseudomonadales bacterium]MDP4640317.1 PadR family transcriptional regulator [Pseudomonadales bacterium]MDP4766284.1 PadR family transcriptional regulator [Pseudomonadales bacterium]MDP4876475.1 PadR family transcriptional regulator [Pseudomonadales bacterium]MDP4912538.1 PadR family transcriptional regulator [Pseudomonadales bacterium]